MRRVAIALLGLWVGGNLFLALAILVAMLVFHQNAPSLMILFTKADVPSIDARALATINALAVFANACAAAFCALVLFVLWRILYRREVWWYWPLFGCSVVLQCMGYASDIYFAHRDVAANIGSTAILILGLIALYITIYKDIRCGQNTA